MKNQNQCRVSISALHTVGHLVIVGRRSELHDLSDSAACRQHKFYGYNTLCQPTAIVRTSMDHGTSNCGVARRGNQHLDVVFKVRPVRATCSPHGRADIGGVDGADPTSRPHNTRNATLRRVPGEVAQQTRILSSLSTRLRRCLGCFNINYRYLQRCICLGRGDA